MFSFTQRHISVKDFRSLLGLGDIRMTCFLTVESMLGQRVKRSERDHLEGLSVARLNYLRSVLADSKQGNLKRVCQRLSHLYQENRASLGESGGNQCRRTEVVWE